MASLCSLERVVRPPAYRGLLDRRNGGRRLRRGNEGTAAGKGQTEELAGRKGRTSQRSDPSGNRRLLARTRNQLAIGNGNGNQLAIEEPSGRKLLA